MPLIVPNSGEILLLTRVLAAGDLTLRLYTNNYTPVAGSTYANFTEMTTQSYALKTLTAGAWTIANDAGTGAGKATYASQTWVFTAGGPTTIYGYYVVDAALQLVWAERFGTAVTVSLGTDSLGLVPTIALSSGA